MRKTHFVGVGLISLAFLILWSIPNGRDDSAGSLESRVHHPAFSAEPADGDSRHPDGMADESSEAESPDSGTKNVEKAFQQQDERRSGRGRVEALLDTRLHRARADARQADRLDAESIFLAGESLQGDTAIQVLNADAEDFDAIISELEQQSQKDPLSSEISDVYRDFLDNDPSLDEYGPVMDRLACGLRICIGESFAGQDQWDRAISRMRDGTAPPSFAMIEIPVYDAAGMLIGRRLMFSTDDQNNSVSMPISYRPPSPLPAEDSDGG